MAALVLTFIASFLVAAVIWLAAGSRMSLTSDEQLNDIANFAVYFGAALPVSFIIVFFGLGASG